MLDIHLCHRQNRWALVSAMCMFLLAAWSRQTLVIFLPLAALLCLERIGLRGVLARPALIMAAASVIMATTIHLLAFMYSGTGTHFLLGMVGYLMDHWSHMFMERHPLLDPNISPPLLAPLLFIGLVLMARFSPASESLHVIA